jgi:DNA ligase D-like protein (predicted ligase)/DNA ligase D-like protein (predicted 3'-phosphoesterase)
MSHSYKPMLAKEAAKPFSDKDWIFEIKWDGFRAIAYVNDEVRLMSRNNIDLITNFPELRELKQLTSNVVLDGEIVVIKNGTANFQAVQERGKAVKPRDIQTESAKSPAQYVIFDILEKNDNPLTNLPLMERKKILHESVREGEHVAISDFIEEKGEDYYEAAVQKGMEGVMGKRKDSLYYPGLRSDSWLKLKKLKSVDCVIFGYTKGTGARGKTFGALILGLYDKGEPVFIGKVGTGFTDKMLEEMSTAFRSLETQNAPFNPEIPDKITWLKPKLVAEIGYQAVTHDRKLRMPRFHGLRTDKTPKECSLNQLFPAELSEYLAKRDFKVTSEPKGDTKTGKPRIYVVQEHQSRRLHFDFRLEKDGVLKSWAVPKGIPETTEDKRLAVQTEDHPIEYAEFAGEIPKGQYGAGTVKIWDKGTFTVKVWEEAKIEFTLNGERLHGRYVLVRLKRAGEKDWLMLKGKEDGA